MLGGRPPTVNDLPKSTYTAQVIKESLRLYPPVWRLARQAKEATDILGYAIEKNAYVFLTIHVIHRDPNRYHHADALDPERFAPGCPKPGRFAYLPFSRRKRQCIGDRFAEMEMILVIATLAQTYEVSLSPGQTSVTQPSVTLRPRDGMSMKIHRRSLDHPDEPAIETIEGARREPLAQTCPMHRHIGQAEE